MIKYVILKASTSDLLASRVEDFMISGWLPLGGAFTCPRETQVTYGTIVEKDGHMDWAQAMGLLADA